MSLSPFLRRPLLLGLLPGGAVRGLLCHPSESDNSPEATAAYQPKLAELIGRV